MCGICGIYNFDGRPVDRALIEKMKATMVHRGPDGHGTYIDGNVGLGHRRLSIIDLAAGHQPMANEDGSTQVVFNGEIYNFLELRNVLESKGHRFRTRSDTEAIIHGYEEWGEGVVDKLEGMFAIGLWDRPNRSLLLARDRVGKKPLYYLVDEHRLLFASELKALLCDPDLSKDINYQALDCYLSYGYVPSPFSILEGVKKLPPAHFAVCKSGRLAIRPYWKLEFKSQYKDHQFEQAVEELEVVFKDAVKKRLVSDVPLGAFLSGGVDSSAVVAAMAAIKGNEPVRTTTIGFSDERYDEVQFARLVAQAYKTDHKEYVVEPNALEVIDRIVWHLDEPFADSSAIPTYYVSRMTRQRVTVALSGDGGDEVFAGYINRYQGVYREEQVRRMLPGGIGRKVLGPVSRVYPRWNVMPRPLRLKNFLDAISRSFESAYIRTMCFYFTPEMKRSLYRHELFQKMEGFDASEILAPHLRQARGLDPVSRAQYTDIMTYLPEDILVKVDRMSMANSLEVRAPVLDHGLMEFVARLPWRWKLKGGESKYIFKKMNEGRLSREILYRKKQGFCVPLAPWLRGDVRGFAEDILFGTGSILRDYFDMKYIKSLWKRHQGGWEDCSAPLWGLMMFELWRRRVLDRV